MNRNDIYNILVKYVDGESSAEEIIIIEKLIGEDNYWKSEFELLKNLNNTISDSGFYKVEAKTDQNWEELKASINETKPVKTVKIFPDYFKYIAAAVVVFVAGWFMLNNFQKSSEFNTFTAEKIYKTGDNEMLEVTLTDGSKITLNQNSELKIDKKFNIDNRLAELKGEAYFEIAKQKSKPFITKSNNTFVKVLGTVFKINNNSAERVEVSLYEGKVEFTSNKNNTILTPGKMVKYSVNTDEITTTKIAETETKFWENKLIFKDEKLKEIAKRLEKRYKISIIVPEEKQNERYTISFEGMNLESSIKLLEELTDSKITKNDSKYFINP